VSLGDLLGPLDRVDYIEADVQQSEIRVFPPFLHLLKRKARRIHIDTHGKWIHDELNRMFATNGWNIVFSYRPGKTHRMPCGRLRTNDGILTVRNPDL
jgi:hypothetical protein